MFVNAQSALFGTNFITVHPIISEGNALLVAFYPTKFKNKIEKILTTNRVYYLSIIENNIKSFRMLNNYRVNYSSDVDNDINKKVTLFDIIANFTM
ncbi:MAG: hypothetical protein D3910_03305 [Candidatus Electrothrix sp. ATG2]|nr:hypothetical protein [Candidatus Electrothrix sp. ATG2]